MSTRSWYEACAYVMGYPDQEPCHECWICLSDVDNVEEDVVK